MLARVYGFDWHTYAEHVMPAFACWLAHEDEKSIHQLYTQTRCAYEEQFVPALMHDLRTWSRAQAFVRQLPQGVYTREEYRLLCDAVAFTSLSDLSVHRHPPKLHETPSALRVIWGAIIDAHCQTSLRVDVATVSGSSSMQPGHHPAPIYFRGWLATVSVRALMLFEFLACGRRSLPFGCRPGEPYEDYIGYLTPDEVRLLADCLEGATPPTAPQAAEKHSTHFPLLQHEHSIHLQSIYDTLPAHAAAFVELVQLASASHCGLICRIE